MGDFQNDDLAVEEGLPSDGLEDSMDDFDFFRRASERESEQGVANRLANDNTNSIPLLRLHWTHESHDSRVRIITTRTSKCLSIFPCVTYKLFVVFCTTHKTCLDAISSCCRSKQRCSIIC